MSKKENPNLEIIEEVNEITEEYFDPYAELGADADLEKQGIWLYMSHFRIKVLPAYAVNRRYREAMVAKTRNYPNMKDLPEKTATSIMAKILAEAIIINWEVVDSKDPTGESFIPGMHDINPPHHIVPFSQDLVVQVLTRKGSGSRLQGVILEFAQEFSNFKKGGEERLKNS